MTALGLYFSKKSINRSEVSRKTGINKTRLSELSNQEKTHLRAEELYLIALAIDVDPGEMFMELHQDLKLPEE
ncbi:MULTISPECIES: helix-turn-helix domain-containing protein [Leeuwenhoekiella]|uniref:helix-turn-helix domain-containing protein n=1 Tax=Leeuwenhoekiella TaxID=283735 RepID=UPI000C3731BA|nr:MULTISPECIES: helix-turn-helix transcriptional regulator [Leeuwenhoekiella]MAO41933.1 DNA-binding protein [Leeuwenhoekiella sp.]|tara:strand:+ start:38 stop:256 length:219 start_codon:yes stop_codon:yes gene_type:complete